MAKYSITYVSQASPSWIRAWIRGISYVQASSIFLHDKPDAWLGYSVVRQVIMLLVMIGSVLEC